MKVLTTGSRDWTGIWGTSRISIVLGGLQMAAAALESPLRLMNGACPEGADFLVKRWANTYEVPLEEFPADWMNYQKAAGPMRNMYMVNQGADMCVAFLKGNSRGTSGTITLARNAKIPTFVIPWQPLEDDLPLVT